MDALKVVRDTPDSADVRALLMRHFEVMRAGVQHMTAFFGRTGALLERGAVLFAARGGDTVLGVGALAQVGPDHGELKSMHTLTEARGRGVGRAILAALLEEARARGMARVSLETGSAEMFTPARALYSAHGFADGPPFLAAMSTIRSVFS